MMTKISVRFKKRWSLLVGEGYFPEELPPCFNSEDLISFIQSPRFSLDRYSNKNDFGAPQSSRILHFSIPHIKGHRRILGLPGPFHYTKLSYQIILNSDAIDEIFNVSTISIFKNYSETNHDRYIPKPNFKDFTEQRILKSTGYRYLLSVDIARFYSSIYTHSIPWAIHGKAFSKDHPQFAYFGNLLDVLTSNCQDKQTMGIPIGPDSSRILSEIILSRVDEKLSSSLLDFEGIRNVDDYMLYFKTIADAEKGRTLLENSLREFELALNPVKERIVELPDIIEAEWKEAIRGFRFRRKPDLERADLIAFFDLSISLVRRFPEDIVLTYAIAKLRGLEVHISNWLIFQAFLINSMVLESRVVVQVSYLLLANSKRPGFELNKTTVLAGYESFLIFHGEHDHHFEIVWGLWFYLETEFVISKDVSDVLNSSTNDFVILMLLKLEEELQIDNELDRTIWKTLVNKDNLFTEHWLLSYEGFASEYFTNNTVSESKYFSELYSNGIHFFKPDTEDDEDERLNAPKYSLAKELEANANRRPVLNDDYNDDSDD